MPILSTLATMLVFIVIPLVIIVMVMMLGGFVFVQAKTYGQTQFEHVDLCHFFGSWVDEHVASAWRNLSGPGEAWISKRSEMSIQERDISLEPRLPVTLVPT
jgi:hypothetical protein